MSFSLHVVSSSSARRQRVAVAVALGWCVVVMMRRGDGRRSSSSTTTTTTTTTGSQRRRRHHQKSKMTEKTARTPGWWFLNIPATVLGAGYTCWVLLGTVGWISHLGERVPRVSEWLPAKGWPGNACVEDCVEFMARNAPLSLIFVLPHSLALPRRLYRVFGRYGRLVYNVMSAATLHAFLIAFRPLKTPVVMTIPFHPAFHDALSVGCLMYASYAFFSSPATLGLLGVSSALRLTNPKYANPANGMDAITWMGVTTWRLGGAFAFVLFTGLSIIPRELTLGDCITRCVAAVYLRQRSRSFREWVGKIEGVHLLTWILRATLLSCACYSALQGGGDIRAVLAILAAAGSLTIILRLAESEPPHPGAEIVNEPTKQSSAEIIERAPDRAPATCDEQQQTQTGAANRPEQWNTWNPHAPRT